MNLLVIDLDGTITKSDNLIGFSYYMIQKEKQFRFLLIFPLLILLKFKLISNVRFKIWYSFLIIKNLKVKYLDNCAQKFISSESFQKELNKDVLAFIHDQKDSNKIIVSANYSFLAEKVAKLLKFEACFSINLATGNGKYSGYISGQIPFGKIKISVVSDFLINKNYHKTIGIGNSKSDLPLLKYLAEGYLVTINKKSDKTTLTKV